MAYEGLVDIVDTIVSLPILLAAAAANGPGSPRLALLKYACACAVPPVLAALIFQPFFRCLLTAYHIWL